MSRRPVGLSIQQLIFTFIYRLVQLRMPSVDEVPYGPARGGRAFNEANLIEVEDLCVNP